MASLAIRHIDKLVDEFPLVLSGLWALPPGMDIVPVGRELEAYVEARNLPKIARRFRLDRSPERPNVILHVPTHRWILERFAKAPPPVAAADLLLHDDPRVARAAALFLERKHR